MLAIDLNDVMSLGAGLERPECVLATRSGDLFVSDGGRGGISVIRPDGSTELIVAKGAPAGFLPNGIALLPGRDVLIANLGGDGGVWRMAPSGEVSLVVDTVDGQALPPINFVGVDAESRLWITVSTRQLPREGAMRKGFGDGFIVVQDERGARIVADGIGYTNEAIVDPTGQWLYVNETIAQRTIRFPIGRDAALGEREVVAHYPPATHPDGFAFDAEGGVWCVSVASNRVIHVAKDGRQTIVLEDADADEMREVAAAFDEDRFERRHIDAGKTRRLANISSIAFGGDDLKTVYLGSLFGDRLWTFRSPVAGARPVHWDY